LERTHVPTVWDKVIRRAIARGLAAVGRERRLMVFDKLPACMMGVARREGTHMCRTRTLSLTPARRRSLIRVRDHAPTPYLRERSAALLKVADGWTLKDVAAIGLLAPRSTNTVAGWVTRYERDGLRSLRIRPGRGRKPAFSPLRADPGSGTGRTP